MELIKPNQHNKMTPNDPKGAIGATKTPLHLIPTVALETEAWVLKLGAEKYGENNWRETGVSSMTYIGAILRHLTAWRDGQDIDLESERSHLGHIRANCAILLDAMHCGTLRDDRPVKPDHITDANKMAEPPAIPSHLPPLPPVPDGYSRWEYRGEIWKADDVYYAHCIKGDEQWFGGGKGQSNGIPEYHYIEAIKEVKP